MNNELLREILNDTAELVRRASKRGTIKLSPESAAALERIQVTRGAATPEEADVSAVIDTDDVRRAELQALAETVAACRKCALCEGRTQTVFADGNPHAELVFVGEAPGENEDREGIPFVGRAGKLLTDIIEKGMKIDRSDVYICNVIKCHPPGNRDPSPEEKLACEEYLIRQLELVKPKVICALGGHAAKTLLRTEASVGSLRNRWHSYHGIPLRVTYHPAYLLRSPGDKKKTWADVQEIMKVLAGEVVPDVSQGIH